MMGNLAETAEFTRLITQSEVAHNRTLSRYGSRESIEPLPPNTGHWFAARCQGNTEFLAAEALKARNFDVYLPIVYAKERPRRGSVREAERPMFSTYVFLRCLPRSDHWDRARNVAGVRQLVGETCPFAIPEEAMDVVRFDEACHATKSGRKALRWKLEPGDEARILTGPFAYFHATVMSAIDDNGRVMALVSIFGRASRAQFDADDLEKL